MSEYNPIISIYRIMDDNRSNVWVSSKLKDMPLQTLVETLNDYMNELDHEDQYIIHAQDETSFVKGLEERQSRLDNLEDCYELTTDSLLISEFGEVDKSFDYDFELWGNHIDGHVFLVNGREIYRSFSDYYSVEIPD